MANAWAGWRLAANQSSAITSENVTCETKHARHAPHNFVREHIAASSWTIHHFVAARTRCDFNCVSVSDMWVSSPPAPTAWHDSGASVGLTALMFNDVMAHASSYKCTTHNGIQQQQINFDFKHKFLPLPEPGQGENRGVEIWKVQGFPSTWLMAPRME